MDTTDDTVPTDNTDRSVSFRVLGPVGVVGRSGGLLSLGPPASGRCSPPSWSTRVRPCRSTS